MDRVRVGLRVLSSFVGAATLIAGFTSASVAQSDGTGEPRHVYMSKLRRVFEWTGHVDHDIELVISGRDYVATRIGSADRVARGSTEFIDLPREEGELTITLAEGRGQAEVAQQPATENGYTAVIRIRDPEAGTGTYRLVVGWQAAAAGDVVPYETAPARELITYAPVTARELTRRIAMMWAGDVDEDLEIVIQPGTVNYHTVRGRDPQRLQSAISETTLPNAQLEVMDLDGRGTVEITEQPSIANNFTARIRIRDPQPGFGRYSFNLIWR